MDFITNRNPTDSIDGAVFAAKNYHVIKYLQSISYKGDFYDREKVLHSRSAASSDEQGN